MSFNYEKLTPFKWFVLQNYPYIDEDFDQITNYGMFCKLGEEINKLIASENILGNQVQNLTDYVSNYFENLDVQEEINNKLDQMAEDGTLQEIITSYLQINGVLAFNTVSDMKQATNLINGSFVKTYGFETLNDNGGAFYKIRAVTNEDVVDELNIIALNDNTLIAELIFNNNLSIYNTIAQLKQSKFLVDGNVVKTLGYNNFNDEGGAFYKIRKKVDTDVIDNSFIISLYNENLVAQLLINNEIRLTQLGATTEIDSTNILNSALNYINTHKEIKLIIDNNYNFTNIDLTNINNIIIEGVNPKKRIKITGTISIPTNHNTFKNLGFELQNDSTLVNITGKYNNFNFCNFYGKNNNTGIGINISSYGNTFTDCSIREFKTNVIINDTANQTNFINCILINCDNAQENNSNIIINGGVNINFTNCDLEKGYHIIETNGGIANINGCYIEGATSQYHIRCYAGTISILNNYLHNVRIEKYTACKLTICNNFIEKNIKADYTLFPRQANIGYLVVLNNKFKDENGLFTLIDGMKVSGVSLPCPRYFDESNNWQVGTRNDYLFIVQENCYGYSGVGKHTCQTLPLDSPQIGTSANRINRPEMSNAFPGQCFYDTTLNKLVVKTSSGEWVDVNGTSV